MTAFQLSCLALSLCWPSAGVRRREGAHKLMASMGLSRLDYPSVWIPHFRSTRDLVELFLPSHSGTAYWGFEFVCSGQFNDGESSAASLGWTHRHRSCRKWCRIQCIVGLTADTCSHAVHRRGRRGRPCCGATTGTCDSGGATCPGHR